MKLDQVLIDAMALLGLGVRSISMEPSNFGAVKAMIVSADDSRLRSMMDDVLATRSGSVRGALRRFAEGDSIEL